MSSQLFAFLNAFVISIFGPISRSAPPLKMKSLREPLLTSSLSSLLEGLAALVLFRFLPALLT